MRDNVKSPMKYILLFSILFCVISLPAFSELTDADLDKIRLIVNEEIKPLKTDIGTLKVDVAQLDGRITGIEKQITWLMALIIVAVGIPQVIVAWRSRKDRELNEILLHILYGIHHNQLLAQCCLGTE